MMVRSTVFVLCEAHEALNVFRRHFDVAHLRLGGRAGIARRDEHFGDARRLRAFPRERVFATAGTNDQNFHGKPCLTGLAAAGAHAATEACRRAAGRSMSEMPHAGEHHRHAVLVGRGDDFIVALRAAWLDHGLDAELRGHVQPVAEGKNASDAITAPATCSFSSAAFSAATRLEYTRLICPAPTPMVVRPRA